MCAMQLIANQELCRVLDESVTRERPVVVTHHGSVGWRALKAAFAASRGSASELTIKLRPLRDEDAPVSVKAGDALGVTFRVGHKKCMFTTEVISAARLSTDQTITVERPDRLQQLQRRVFERAKPPGQAVIPVRIWRETGETVPVEERTIRHGQLEDMSAGGMRVKVACAADFEIGVVYRCAFSPRAGKPSVVVDALVRHHEAANQGRASIGFQYVGLETSAEGHRMMERLAQAVTHYQRARSRPHRRKPSAKSLPPTGPNDPRSS